MAKATKQPEQPVLETSTIVIELGEQTKQVLVDLTNAILSQKAPVINLKSVDSTVLEALVQGLSQPIAYTVPSTGTEAPTKVPATTAKAQQPKPEPAKTDAVVTLTQIREMTSSKVNTGKREAIVALLAEFGVKNASTLEEHQYADYYQQLSSL